MSNYVLFIGGTGARVYRAFLHICATGTVREREINALLLDVDSDNQAVKVCCELYQLYQKHHEELQDADTNAISQTPPFYCDIRMPQGTKAISPIQGNVSTPIQNNVSNLEHTANEDMTLKRAMNWFYSQKEREQNLKNGFYAHPNIGCVFFQNFKDAAMQQFLVKIKEDLKAGETVKVVLVGSVFGGTGASGLPSVMKLIRANCGDHIEKFHCFGVLVTPYFEVPAPDDEERKENLVINSSNFYHNTRTALEYYRDYGTFERTYLVGKDKLDQVSLKYVSGGQEQDNKSHIVEICAAMAVRDSFEGQRAPGAWGHIIHEEAVTWMTLGRELYPVADMIRMQVILKGNIYPYIRKMSRQRKLWHPCSQWYKVYRAGSEAGEDLLRMEQYTDDFLNWIYDIQTGYGANARNLDGSVQLCGTLVTEFEECLGLSNAEIASLKEQRSAMEKFNNLIDTAANIEYVFDKVILILSCLGVVNSSLATLGCFGLLIRLFEIVGQKKERRKPEHH